MPADGDVATMISAAKIEGEFAAAASGDQL
jgi:hypothetical protein